MNIATLSQIIQPSNSDYVYGRLNSQHVVGGPVALHCNIKEKLRFSYDAGVSSAEFAKAFHAKGGLSARCAAIVAVIKLIVLTLFQAICSIFAPIGCPSGEAYRLRNYRLARTAEALFGNFLAIFSEQRGAFMTQRAEFHLSCYKGFEKQTKLPVAMIPRLSATIHYAELQTLSKAKQDSMLKELRMPFTTEEIDAIPDEDRKAMLINAMSSIAAGTFYPWYWIASDAELLDVRLVTFAAITRDEDLALSIRFRELYTVTEKLPRTDNIVDIKQATLRELLTATGAALTPHVAKLDRNLLSKLSDTQLGAIDFSQIDISLFNNELLARIVLILSDEQIQANDFLDKMGLFGLRALFIDLLPKEGAIKKLFTAFSEAQINQLIKKIGGLAYLMPADLIAQIPIEAIQKISFINEDSKQWIELLLSSPERAEAIFKALSTENLAEIAGRNGTPFYDRFPMDRVNEVQEALQRREDQGAALSLFNQAITAQMTHNQQPQ